jgi:hypothetical protein
MVPLCPPAQTSIAAPTSRGEEPSVAATDAHHPTMGRDGGPQCPQVKHARPPSDPSSKDRRRPAPAPPLPAPPRPSPAPAAPDRPAIAAGRHRIRQRHQRRDAQHEGRLAHRLRLADRILAVRAVPERHVEHRRPVRTGRDLVGAGRMGRQPALAVPDQFLGGQPARALHIGALDLADVQRRVQAGPGVMQMSARRMRFSPVSVSITTSVTAAP